jgi:hypothetical protein
MEGALIGRRLFVLASAATLTAGACSGDNDRPAPQKSNSPVVTPSPEPSAQPSVVDSATGAASPKKAALGLHDAWNEDDRAAALDSATQAAINKLFAHNASKLKFSGCSPKHGRFICFFYYEGGGLDMIVKGTRSTGYLVTRTYFVAD